MEEGVIMGAAGGIADYAKSERQFRSQQRISAALYLSTLLHWLTHTPSVHFKTVRMFFVSDTGKAGICIGSV